MDPTRIPGVNAMQVCATSHSSSALSENVVQDRSNWWAWGTGEEGQLMNGGENWQTPEPVDLKGREVIQAELGAQHSIILLKPRLA